MVVQLVGEGLLIGADRNVTTHVRAKGTVRVGQTRRPKVLKWPNRGVLVGYVGLAEIGTQATDEWLYGFIGRHLEDGLETLAHALKYELESAIPRLSEAQPLIIHLGGFESESQDDDWRPVVWFIRNTRTLNTQTGMYEDTCDDFVVSEEMSQPIYFGEQSGKEVRARAAELARQWRPFWFHQGYDLGTFNLLDNVMRQAMRAIVETHPGRPRQFPSTLGDWANHLRMAIGTYGAYFEAFHEPFEQYVGGGADVVWAAWPENSSS
jgi:hypothetical protein